MGMFTTYAIQRAMKARRDAEQKSAEKPAETNREPEQKADAPVTEKKPETVEQKSAEKTDAPKGNKGGKKPLRDE